MTDRREFISALAVAGLWPPISRRRSSAPRVEASASVFYAHPGAETTLVRFSVLDANAPAGRMRVFESSGRRLLGTAGVLGVGGTLFGELWLPLRSETRIVSQLEMPGLAQPLRTQHDITPQPRWTLHWITVADPEQVVRYLRSLPTWRRIAAVAMLKQIGVKGNPFAASEAPIETSDHVSLLRLGVPARKLEDEFNIRVSPVAVVGQFDLAMHGSVLALAGGGIGTAALWSDAATTTITTLATRDGSAVRVAAIPVGSTPSALGFDKGRDVMAKEVERRLSSDGGLSPSSQSSKVLLLVGTTVDDSLLQMAQAVADWNSRYAFPHIVVGDASSYFESVRVDTAPSSIQPVGRRMPPASEEVTDAMVRREAERVDRTAQMLAPLNALLESNVPGVAGLAQHLGVRLNGTVIFNPSPVPRTDIVIMPDGSEQMVTDVPAIGYAYLPAQTSKAPAPFLQIGPHSAFGQLFTVRLNSETGAISSLYNRADDREWVRSSGRGLNAVRGAVLENVTRLRLPSIGMRLIAQRRTDWGLLKTTVTVYEAQPWIDITNEFEDDTSEVLQYDFHFAVNDPQVVWETPAGFEEASAPLGSIAHLRWMMLRTEENWQVLFRGLDSPYAACDADGRIVSFAPRHRSRYRIKVASPYAAPDEPWHFGWSTDPLQLVPVSGTATSSRPLPRFGHLIGTDGPGVAVIGIKPADNGDGAIVFLQELIGATRSVKLTGGILGFLGARHVDLTERHYGELTVTSEPAVTVPLSAYGVATVRLLELHLRGG